jgi:hypothetical protein
MFTTASLIGSSDMLGIMPSRLFTSEMLAAGEIPLSQLNAESIEISLHYNKLSCAIRYWKTSSDYPSGFLTGEHKPLHMQGKRHKTTTILQIADLAGCFMTVSMIYCLSFVQK